MTCDVMKVTYNMYTCYTCCMSREMMEMDSRDSVKCRKSKIWGHNGHYLKVKWEKDKLANSSLLS